MLSKCKRCLLREMQGDVFAEVSDLLAAMPAEEKAADALYEARLALCKACDHLVGGICTKCGCFVELRAARAAMRCPDAARKW